MSRRSIVLVAAALLFCACSGAIEGSGTGGAAAGGAGGTAPPLIDICACMDIRQVEEASQGPCFTCMNTGYLECVGFSDECAADPGCIQINDCVGQQCSTIECAMQCFLPLDEDHAHERYREHIGCLCSMCEEVCSGESAFSCEVPDPVGSGAGGSTTTTTPTPGPIDICECLDTRQAEEATNGPCFTCMNTAYPVCLDVANTCASDPACFAINECVGQQCSTIECAMDCFLPFDEDQAHERYRDHIGCICSMCHDVCKDPTAITCDAPAGGT